MSRPLIQQAGFWLRKGEWLFFALIAILLALPATRSVGVNVMSRFAATVRVVEAGTLDLGPYAAKTTDLAVVDGKSYTDKAPGLSLMLAPFYALARLLTKDFWAGLHVTRTLSLTLLTLLSAFAWNRRLQKFGMDDFDRRLCVAIFAVGTTAWPYFTMLYGHGPSTLFVFWATVFFLDYRADERTPSLVLAGVCYGLAICVEYPTAVMGGCAGIYFLTFERRVARIAVFAFFGAVVPALVIMNFNNALFGGPFTFGYHLEHSEFYREQMSRGLFGIGAPSLQTAALLLISPSKGLLFWSPVAVMGFIATLRATKERRGPALFLAGMVVAYVVVLSGYFEASGSACLGPRHLTPLVAPLCLGLALGLGHVGAAFRGLTLAAAVFSTLLLAAGIATEPQVFEQVRNPLWEYFLPLLRQGVGAGNTLGLPDAWASAVLIGASLWIWLLVARSNRSTDAQAATRFRVAALTATLVLAIFYGALAPRIAKTDAGILAQSWGNFWSLRGEYRQAVVSYERAAELRDDPYIRYYQGIAYTRLDQRDQAARVFGILQRDHPGFLESEVERRHRPSATTNAADSQSVNQIR